MQIILDRKHKRKSSDDQWVDVLGVQQSRTAKLNELPIDKQGTNPIDKFLLTRSPKELLGYTIWAFGRDQHTVVGKVVDVYPARILLIKVNGKNKPVEFESVFSMEKQSHG